MPKNARRRVLDRVMHTIRNKELRPDGRYDAKHKAMAIFLLSALVLMFCAAAVCSYMLFAVLGSRDGGNIEDVGTENTEAYDMPIISDYREPSVPEYAERSVLFKSHSLYNTEYSFDGLKLYYTMAAVSEKDVPDFSEQKSTEDYRVIHITVGDGRGVVRINRSGTRNLVCTWQDGEYLYTVSGNCDTATAVKLAKSVAE